MNLVFYLDSSNKLNDIIFTEHAITKGIIYITYLFPLKQLYIRFECINYSIYWPLNYFSSFYLVFLSYLRTLVFDFFYHRVIVICCASCQYRRLLKSIKQFQPSSPSASPGHSNAMYTSSTPRPGAHKKAVRDTSLPTTDNPSYHSLGKFLV